MGLHRAFLGTSVIRNRVNPSEHARETPDHGCSDPESDGPQLPLPLGEREKSASPREPEYSESLRLRLSGCETSSGRRAGRYLSNAVYPHVGRRSPVPDKEKSFRNSRCGSIRQEATTGERCPAQASSRPLRPPAITAAVSSGSSCHPAKPDTTRRRSHAHPGP